MRCQNARGDRPIIEDLESRQLLSVSIPKALVPAVANARPTITALTANPNPVTKGQPFALVATGVADSDGTVAKVEFYRDANGDGLFEKSIDPLVGLDGSPGKGWNAYIDTTAMNAGTYTYFARSRDNLGEVSKPAVMQVRVGVTAVNARPTIAALTASPNPAIKGDRVALVATGVADSDGTVAKVEFYRDANGDGLFEKDVDPLVGLDGSPSKGWNAYVDTSSLAVGNYTYFARSRDNLGEVSKPAIVQCKVQTGVSLLGQWTGTANFTKGSSGTQGLQMNVTSQTGMAYFSGTLSVLDTFEFNATIGKNNKVTMTFSKGTSGSATGTLDLTQMTFTGSFSVKNSDGSFAGTFSLTKV